MTAYVSLFNIGAMRLVMKVDGAYELNWTWLPYWLVTDQEFRDAAGVIMFAAAEANPDTVDTLEKINEVVTQALVNRYPSSGIEELITALKCVPRAALGSSEPPVVVPTAKVVEGIRG